MLRLINTISQLELNMGIKLSDIDMAFSFVSFGSPYEHAAVLNSFHQKTALFRRGCVNLRTCLCDVKYYASAQILDFLATTKIFSFPI